MSLSKAHTHGLHYILTSGHAEIIYRFQHKVHGTNGSPKSSFNQRVNSQMISTLV